MATLGSDVRYALRLLRRSPGFTIAAMLTLALGIGVNTAMFTVVNGVLLRPLPYAEPDRVMAIWATRADVRDAALAPANFLDLQRDSRSFERIAAYREDVFDLASGGGDPQRLEGAQITAAFFDVFGVPAILGRTIREGRDEPGGEPVAVLGEAAWVRAFGRDPAIVGRTIRVNGGPVTVVGVMPAGFEWPEGISDIWVLAPKPVPTPPIDVPGDFVEQRGLSYFDAVGRLGAGVTLERATSELDRIAARLARDFPDNNTGRGLRAVPLKEQIVADVRPALLMLLATVGLLLLIASANVAGLFLARAAGRQREVGIRSSLGAPRWRLVRQFLTESVVLSIAGALLGLAVAAASLRVLVAITPAQTLPRLAEVDLDLRVVAFTALCALLSAALFGLAPAIQASRVNLATALRDGDRGVSGGTRRLGSLLVVGQVALTLVVLMGAGLLLNSFLRLQRIDPGFRPERIMGVDLPLPQARYDTPARQTAFYRDLRDRLAGRPDLVTAAIFPIPFGGGTNSSAPLRRVGKPEPPPGQVPTVLLGITTPDAFATLGIGVIAGRDFTEQDTDGAPQVAIVSAEAVRRYWPGEDPVGSAVTLGSDSRFTIVGVVGDTRRQGLDIAPEPTIYLSYHQLILPFMTLLVRTTGEPESVVADVRAAVRAIDPDLPLGDARTLDQRVSQAVAEPRFRTVLVLVFGAVALLLASVGVYGLISYSVAQRVREMGIRLALGATPGQVLRLAMRQGLLLTVAGIAAGVAAALPLMRLLASLLFGVGAGDPMTFVAVVTLLIAVAAAASYVPARRAARVDPMIALRAE